MHSSVDPCFYYRQKEGRLVIMISWINDNMILGPADLVMELKAELMKQFECDMYEVPWNTLEERSSMMAMMLSGLF